MKRDWNGWIKRMGGRIEGIRMSSGATVPPKLAAQIDWLAIAIYHMGGVSAAARKIGVNRQQIYNYLDEGLGPIPFRRVAQIAKEGDVPIQYLVARMDPWPTKKDGSLKAPWKEGSAKTD